MTTLELKMMNDLARVEAKTEEYRATLERIMVICREAGVAESKDAEDAVQQLGQKVVALTAILDIANGLCARRGEERNKLRAAMMAIKQRATPMGTEFGDAEILRLAEEALNA